MKHAFKSLAALCLALMMILSLTACSRGGEASSEPENVIPELSRPAPAASSGADDEDVGMPDDAPGSFLDKIIEHHELNNDTVGWLYVPNTDINEVVVQSTDNNYYLRRTNLRADDFYGCYYADFEAKLSGGAMSRNTIIYGHSMDDDPNGRRFSQLKRWLDIDFAQENPYIYFSTPEKDMVYKIFSVMYTSKLFNYVQTDPNNTEFLNIINEARQASQFNYPVEVSATDEILTLSTCTYIYGMANKNQRFVVMARKVRPGEEVPATIELEKNPNPKKPNV